MLCLIRGLMMQNFAPSGGTMSFRPTPGSAIALAGNLQPDVRGVEQIPYNPLLVLPCR